MRTHCDRGLRTLLVFAALVAMTSAVGAARAQSWGQLAELSQSVGLVSGFGTSVAISGSTAVVGEPSADGGQGAVYVFVESAGGWGNMTPLGRECKESKVGGLSRLPSVSLPSVAVGVDIAAAPAPRGAVREISPGLQLRSPGTLPRQLPGLRRSPWPADTPPRGFLVCRCEHTTPRIAKSVQPSP
jgi:hypothetical protein